MPITLHPISRRRFLSGSLAAAGAAWLGAAPTLGQEAVDVDPRRIALLSDIHIAADMEARTRGVTMAEHLRQVCAEVVGLRPRPAMALINGDCAYLLGQSEDYATLLTLLEPVREAGIPIHLTMGNHDRRDHFWKALPADESRVKAIEDRQVLILDTPDARWVMLDSLDKTNATPGLVGPAQLDWLKQSLDAKTDKPTIVSVHHNPGERKPKVPASAPATQAAPGRQTTQPIRGLIDASDLLAILNPRKHVKALFFGHTHAWERFEQDGLHLVNLPAVAYVFEPGQPSGWIDLHLAPNAMTMELRSIDPAFADHGKKHELTWR